MIAFIIGHDEKSQGAYSECFEKSEFQFYKELESDLKEIGDVYFHDSKIGSYSSRMIDTANRIHGNYRLVIALHFNAFNGKAKGCEALYITAQNEAVNFCHHYTQLTGASNRGAKKLNRNSRGFLEIYYPKYPAILLEPFFGDNPTDCKLFDKDKFIQAIKCI